MTVFTPPMGAFPPNTRYDNQKSYGDLANLGNLRDFRQYRHEIFTTDFRGFRNLSQFESNSRPDILLVGDSFGAGAGVTDMDSPSVRLYAALHRKVYNAAGRPNDLDLALNLIHNLDFRGGMILWQLSERFDLPEGDLGVDFPARAGASAIPAIAVSGRTTRAVLAVQDSVHAFLPVSSE